MATLPPPQPPSTTTSYCHHHNYDPLRLLLTVATLPPPPQPTTTSLDRRGDTCQVVEMLRKGQGIFNLVVISGQKSHDMLQSAR